MCRDDGEAKEEDGDEGMEMGEAPVRRPRRGDEPGGGERVLVVVVFVVVGAVTGVLVEVLEAVGRDVAAGEAIESIARSTREVNPARAERSSSLSSSSSVRKQPTDGRVCAERGRKKLW
eukprot:TRINITY_DN17856_c0_g1_i1.p2 TRINITY_DN17856_c0_g1~~TRINITY_DN17856_c0_g1_i1.p2  ORF type:complete len:119 (-),score=24.32 TRINITY_DN17856_c0_g1_i1:17-373(-)